MEPKECLNSENEFKEEIKCAYTRTRIIFDEWHTKPEYKGYVVPLSTMPIPGFAIFYTPAYYRPNLLIIGQNPGNFSSSSNNYKDDPNGEMLSGTGPPKVNSYIKHEHKFAETLKNCFKDCFKGDLTLLNSAVGMNVWHFQQPKGIRRLPPKALRDFCADTTRRLIEVMEPKVILCFGVPACKALENVGKGEVWHLPHLTGSFTRAKARAEMPIALKKIREYLDGSDSARTG